MSSYGEPPDNRTLEQLRNAVEHGEPDAAGELCRRMNLTSVDQAVQRLWPDKDSSIGATAHDALVEGLRPYVLEEWERELHRRRTGT